jgi:hypothetical protein
MGSCESIDSLMYLLGGLRSEGVGIVFRRFLCSQGYVEISGFCDPATTLPTCDRLLYRVLFSLPMTKVPLTPFE